jgi:hypothetical protein
MGRGRISRKLKRNNNVNFDFDEKEFISSDSDYISCSDCSSPNTSSASNNCSSRCSGHYTASSSNSDYDNVCNNNSESSDNEVDEDKLANDVKFINETMEKLVKEDVVNDLKQNISNKSLQQTNEKLPSIKKKIIVLENETDRIFEEECEKFLSTESIDKILNNRCCKYNCIKVISPNYEKCNYSDSFLFIQSLRTELLCRTREERAERIYDMLKGIVIVILLYMI